MLIPAWASRLFFPVDEANFLHTPLLFCLAILAAQLTFAGEKDAELKQIQDKLNQLSQDQSQAKKSRQSEQKLLSIVEKSMGEASRSLKRIAGQVESVDQRLSNLSAQKIQLEADLKDEQSSLGLQVRLAYQMGREEQIKLLLSQQDPAQVSRTLAYYGYLNQARSEKIASARNTLAELNEVNQQMAEKKSELEVLTQSAEKNRNLLSQQRQERKVLLASIVQDIRARENKIDGLRKNEKALQDLLASLQTELKDIPEQLSSQVPFSSNRGKLTWPVAGIFEARFGQKRDAGEAKWRGMLIRAPEGKEVRSIAYGRIAFADWLKGYGLLVIVDHGDGYMSLYGHNQSLFKAMGDWVAPGEIISSVGNSGGEVNAGLYFEIRKNGEPVDPSSWCRQVAAK